MIFSNSSHLITVCDRASCAIETSVILFLILIMLLMFLSSDSYDGTVLYVGVELVTFLLKPHQFYKSIMIISLLSILAFATARHLNLFKLFQISRPSFLYQ